MHIEEFWRAFLSATGRAADTRYLDCFCFDLSERVANELLALVLCGKKRATASSLYAFAAEGSRVPQPGDLSIVTDWAGNPRCVIETTAVTVLPFCDVTFDLCKREGEDECLETWQAGHRRFFTEDGAALGYSFSETMPVVFEDFALVYPIEA